MNRHQERLLAAAAAAALVGLGWLLWQAGVWVVEVVKGWVG